MPSALSIIRERRAALRQHFDVARRFAEIEESCVPSYLHPNPLASGIAWWRQVAAVRLARKRAPAGPILDVGAASGELWHLLGRPDGYEFVEADETMAAALAHWHPGAMRQTLANLPQRRYAAVFALDSLEHNNNVDALLTRLADALAMDGVFILSGPTETWLYRAGRRLAGFDGHYHRTTIYDIEALAERHFRRRERRTLPVPGLAPLFNVSAWNLR